MEVSSWKTVRLGTRWHISMSAQFMVCVISTLLIDRSGNVLLHVVGYPRIAWRLRLSVTRVEGFVLWACHNNGLLLVLVLLLLLLLLNNGQGSLLLGTCQLLRTIAMPSESQGHWVLLVSWHEAHDSSYVYLERDVSDG